MDIHTLTAVLEEALRMRVRYSQEDLEKESDFTMGKVVALDHMIAALRDTIDHEDTLRAQEAV